MKSKLFVISLACLAIGLLGSCQKDFGYDNPQQNDLPFGALPGKFSVSEKKQVHFSQGNLYWDGRAFNFETNQYDFSPSVNGNWDTGHISHFYWSKDASNTYKNTFKNSWTKNCVFFTNARAETAKADFTVNGVTGKYRTLSANEWGYLFRGRKMKNGSASYTLNITYGGINGLVLYPDDYEGPCLISGTKYTNENFPDDCVFLPTAGSRKDKAILDVGKTGTYWSSSSFNNTDSFVVYYNKTNIMPANNIASSSGTSVRLVTDVE